MIGWRALSVYLAMGLVLIAAGPQVSAKSGHGSKREEKSSLTTESQPAPKVLTFRNPYLRQTYDSLEAFRPDRALKTLARLRVTEAAGGLRTDKQRLRMTRLLLLAGEAFKLDENLPAARTAYYLAAHLSPGDSTAICSLANCERDLQHFAAEKSLNDQLEKLPSKSVFVYKTLARHAAREHEYKRAIDYLKTAQALEGGNGDAHLQMFLAKIYIAQGCGVKSIEQLKRAAQCIHNPYSRELLLADACTLSLDDGGFEEHLLKAGKIYPYDPAWRVKLGNFYFCHAREKDGFDLLSEALKCKRFSSRAYASLAFYYSGIEHFDQALNTVQRLEQLLPPSSNLSDTKADIYKAKGDIEKAEKYYKEAIAQDAMFAKGYGSYAILLDEKKRYKEARDVMAGCIKSMPEFWRPRFIFASILLDAGDLKAAADQARAGLALLREPEDQLNLYARHQAGKGHAILGALYYSQGKFEEAAAEAKRFNQLKFEAKLPDLLKMVVIRPAKLKFDDKLGLKDAMTRAAVADMLLECGNLNGAASEYKKALAIAPNNTELHSYLLHVYSAKGDWSEAAKENIVLSQKIVNRMPASIGKWQHGPSGVTPSLPSVPAIPAAPSLPINK